MSPRLSWRAWLARLRLWHTIQWRMVLLFLLLASAMSLVFLAAAQQAFSVGWREAARPLLMDYVDHLVRDITADGPPSVPRAQALTERLPLTVRIEGPQVNWASHPGQSFKGQRRQRPDPAEATDPERREHWDRKPTGPRLLHRRTADGHRISFGLNDAVFERRPRFMGYALAAVLLLTLLAWWYVRRLLQPLEVMGQHARRFGAGDFSQPLPEHTRQAPGELGELASTINTMGQDIRQMLDAKRALLLAISHELRSPLTRARLHAELLPETEDIHPQREALLRDLQDMTRLIADLLESERLSSPHTALQREPLDMVALAQSVQTELLQRQPTSTQRPLVVMHAAPALPRYALDPSRMRLLLRNLLDNALRHNASAQAPVELHLIRTPTGLALEVRDHGPGVPEDQLPHLAQPFYRPDTARTRAQGGVGLGLYLCKLVAQAHGGSLHLRNAHPGLLVRVTLPDQGVV